MGFSLISIHIAVPTNQAIFKIGTSITQVPPTFPLVKLSAFNQIKQIYILPLKVFIVAVFMLIRLIP